MLNFFIFLWSLVSLASAPTISINLESHTVVTLRGEVTSESVSRVIREIAAVPGSTVHLYIISQGGSIFDGARLVDFLTSIRQTKKVTCIAEMAFSMAFVILQACDERYVMASSVLMQHQPSYALAQNYARNQGNFVNFLTEYTTMFDDMQAFRLGISTEKFRTKVAHDWWLFGKKAVKERAADAVVNVTCEKLLYIATETITLHTMFGTIEAVFTRCPLVPDPIDVRLVGGELNVEQKAEVLTKLRGRFDERRH